jgi:hypothetical protein
MSKNANLNKAKKAKNDEFYTQLNEIEDELKHYRDYFKNKTVYLNCDDPKESNFFKYFALNFEFLGLKKLISTHFDKDKPTYKLEITGDHNGDGKVDMADAIKTPLKGNGDFRNAESIDILKEVDVVVTNPPFSLFREYIAQLIEHNKDFLIIGPMGATGYKDIAGLFSNKQIVSGYTQPKTYKKPDGSISKHGNHIWLTNLKGESRKELFIPYLDFEEAINTGKLIKPENADFLYESQRIVNIPKNYYGLLAVPESISQKFDWDKYEILGIDREFTKDKNRLLIDGKRRYARFVIRKTVKEVGDILFKKDLEENDLYDIYSDELVIFKGKKHEDRA